jgi:hypothetical protein
MTVLLEKTRRTCLCLALLAVVLHGIGCSPGVPEITIAEQNATLSPVIVGSGSLFMKIINAGRGEDALVRAQVSIPGALVELHDVDEGKMVRTDRIRIPGQSTVQLRPAGVHLMIYKMPKNVTEGYKFILTLSFEKTGDMFVPMRFIDNATVRKTRQF